MMRQIWFTSVCALALGGCTDDPVGLGDDGTGSTSLVAPTSTDSGDDSADDLSDDNPDDDSPDDGVNDTTTDDDGTGTGGASADGTDSTSETTSTPCTPGEEGCECTEDDPPCDEGLVCIVDTCAVPMCPADDHEPENSDHLTPVDLGAFDDGDPGDTLVSILSGPSDVDWWFYDCMDTLVPEVDPAVEITHDSPLEVCQYLECQIGGNALFPNGCPDGTTEDSAPILNQFGGQLTGCCGTDNFTVADYNCPDSDNDSVTVYLKVDGVMMDECVDYSIDFHC